MYGDTAKGLHYHSSSPRPCPTPKLTPIQIDVNKLAALTGYTPGSAGVTLGKIKQKIRALADSVSGVPSIPNTPRKNNKVGTPSSTARKRRIAISDGSVSDTPSKKSKKAGQDKIQQDADDEPLFPDMIAVKKEEDKDHFFGEDSDFILLSGLQG